MQGHDAGKERRPDPDAELDLEAELEEWRLSPGKRAHTDRLIEAGKPGPSADQLLECASHLLHGAVRSGLNLLTAAADRGDREALEQAWRALRSSILVVEQTLEDVEAARAPGGKEGLIAAGLAEARSVCASFETRAENLVAAALRGAPATSRLRRPGGGPGRGAFMPPLDELRATAPAAGADRPLPSDLRHELEGAAGLRLDDVRVREDGTATALDARAFTLGDEVVFAPGEYNPDSREGRALIAHEVMHTVQQRGQATAPMAKRTVTAPGDAVEEQADAFAAAFASGDRAAARSLAANPVRSAPGTIARDPGRSGKTRHQDQPVLYLRRHGEAASRTRVVRVSLSAQVRNVPLVVQAVLVAYGMPGDRAAEIDALLIEVDPSDSPGITRADLRNSGGVVTVGVSPRLDEYLRDLAGRTPRETSERPGATPPGAPAVPPAQDSHPAEESDRRAGGSGPAHESAPHPAPEGGSRKAGGHGRHETLPLPPRLRGIFPQGIPDPPTAADRVTWRAVLDELQAMSDEDITLMRLVAGALTDQPARFLASIRLYKKMKAHYRSVLDEALRQAADDPGPLEKSRGADRKELDASTFRRWSRDQKEREARERMAELRNKQLADMVKNPGQTMKDIGKAMLRPDEQLADVNRSLYEASRARAGYEKAAKATEAASKMSAVVSGMLAFVAVFAFVMVPGAQVGAIMSMSVVLMMTSAGLSMVDAELYVKAAGEATTIDKYDEMVRGGAEAQTRSWIAMAGMATAIAGALIARIPLPGRLQSVGNALKLARSAVANNVGEAWKSIRTSTVEKLRAATAGLRESLAGETAALAALRKELDGLSAETFYQRILADARLRQSLGMSEESARSLAEMARSPQGQKAAHQVFDELRAAYRDGPGLARQQLDDVIQRIENHARALEAAQTSEQFDQALAGAQSDLGEEAVGAQMSERGARQTADKLKQLAADEKPGEHASGGEKGKHGSQGDKAHDPDATAAAPGSTFTAQDVEALIADSNPNFRLTEANARRILGSGPPGSRAEVAGGGGAGADVRFVDPAGNVVGRAEVKCIDGAAQGTFNRQVGYAARAQAGAGGRVWVQVPAGTDAARLIARFRGSRPQGTADYASVQIRIIDEHGATLYDGPLGAP